MEKITPIDIDSLTRQTISDSSQRKHYTGVKNLSYFFQTINCATSKNDQSTNIIDQGEKRTYAMSNNEILKLLDLLNACVQEKSICRMSERQTINNGLMIDLDIYTSKPKFLSDVDYHRLTNAIFTILQEDLVLTESHYIFYTVRQTIDPVMMSESLNMHEHARMNTVSGDGSRQCPNSGNGSGPSSIRSGEDMIHPRGSSNPRCTCNLGSANGSESGESKTGSVSESAFKCVFPEKDYFSSPKLGTSVSMSVPIGSSCTCNFDEEVNRGEGKTSKTNTKHFPDVGSKASVDLERKVSQVYKYGCHILLPGLQLSKAYRRFFLQKLKDSRQVLGVMADLNAIEPSKCVDTNSSNVPVLFYGSCKIASRPYILSKVFNVFIQEPGTNAMLVPVDIQSLDKYNLVAEMSLCTQAYYKDYPPLVTATSVKYKPEVQDYLNNNIIDVDTSILLNDTLSSLAIENPEARYLYGLLDILTDDYYTDRNKWRNVVFAIANTSKDLKPLAEWFSQKSLDKWDSDEFEKMWQYALYNRTAKPITISSVIYWAQSCDLDAFNSVTERSYLTSLMKHVYDLDGILGQYTLAEILYIMLQNKYCIDEDCRMWTWYEFITPGQKMQVGEIWKWRKESEPITLSIYISTRLKSLVDEVKKHIEEKKETSDTDNQLKYYNMVSKNLDKSKSNLLSSTFKNGLIRECKNLFIRYGFAKSLDMSPDALGVGNGVLHLDKKCSLVDHFHEWPISIYTPVRWSKFDPENPYTKIVLKAFNDIIIEPDMRNWFLYHACQGLSRSVKEGIILLLEGAGQNGKTTLLRWICKSLGPYADKFNINLLSDEKEDSNKPNSALMKFKYLNWAYAEETNVAQVLNTARLKEIVNAGEVSTRELHKSQETFTIRSNIVVASQYSFHIKTTDHGTWRRIGSYLFKKKMCKNPSGSFEMLEDSDFNMKYADDPNILESMFSLLVHKYELLMTKYHGQLKNIPCPTLDRETEEFRNSQDAINKWICENFVTNDTSLEYDMKTITLHYVEWYKIHVCRNTTNITTSMFIKDIRTSAIGKYLKPTLNKSFVLKGLRLITAETPIEDNESYISMKETSGKVDVTIDNDWWNY